MTDIVVDDVDAIQRKIVKLIVAAAPDNWKEVILWYESVGAEAEGGRHKARALSNNAAEELKYIFTVDPQIFLYLEELRELMYRQGLGTWISMNLTVNAEGYSILNFDSNSPLRMMILPPSIYQNELEIHPRSSEAIPEWWPQTKYDGVERPGKRFALTFAPPKAKDGNDVSSEIFLSAIRMSDLKRVIDKLKDAGFSVERNIEGEGLYDPAKRKDSKHQVLGIGIGDGGYMCLGFWHDTVFWIAETIDDRVDMKTFVAAFTTILTIVHAATGWKLHVDNDESFDEILEYLSDEQLQLMVCRTQ